MDISSVRPADFQLQMQDPAIKPEQQEAPPEAAPAVAPPAPSAVQAPAAAGQPAGEVDKKAEAPNLPVPASLAGAGDFNPNSVQFERDADSGRVAVKIVDQNTGEVVKEIPSEAMLKTMKSIHDAIGLMLDKTA